MSFLLYLQFWSFDSKKWNWKWFFEVKKILICNAKPSTQTNNKSCIFSKKINFLNNKNVGETFLSQYSFFQCRTKICQYVKIMRLLFGFVDIFDVCLKQKGFAVFGSLAWPKIDPYFDPMYYWQEMGKSWLNIKVLIIGCKIQKGNLNRSITTPSKITTISNRPPFELDSWDFGWYFFPKPKQRHKMFVID